MCERERRRGFARALDRWLCAAVVVPTLALGFLPGCGAGGCAHGEVGPPIMRPVFPCLVASTDPNDCHSVDLFVENTCQETVVFEARGKSVTVEPGGQATVEGWLYGTWEENECECLGTVTIEGTVGDEAVTFTIFYALGATSMFEC